MFYTYTKSQLLIGVRETFNQHPIPGIIVRVAVDCPAPLRRPPAVKPEWCESPEAYAKRLIDQAIDYVVQVRVGWRCLMSGSQMEGLWKDVLYISRGRIHQGHHHRSGRSDPLSSRPHRIALDVAGCFQFNIRDDTS